VNSIKTGVVCVVLLGVGVGLWFMLNQKEFAPPADVPVDQPLAPPQVETGLPEPGSGPAALGSPAGEPGGPPPLFSPHRDGGNTTNVNLDPDGPPAPWNAGAAADDPGDAPKAAGQSSSKGGVTPATHQDHSRMEPIPPLKTRSLDTIAPIAPDDFQTAMESARGQLEQNQPAIALLKLSLYRQSAAGLDSSKAKKLYTLLDQLAAKVVYSREHLLGPPHVVRAGETLQDIAQKYQVPWQLLQKINGIADPQRLTPGTELKVVSGPFNAVVNVQRGELTLSLKRYYAGRFAVAVGQNPPPKPGSYVVRQKMTDPVYYDRTGQAIKAGQPGNPFGDYRLDLDRGQSLHGVTPSANVDGCMALSNRDAEDLHAILSLGSKVEIRR